MDALKPLEGEISLGDGSFVNSQCIALAISQFSQHKPKAKLISAVTTTNGVLGTVAEYEPPGQESSFMGLGRAIIRYVHPPDGLYRISGLLLLNDKRTETYIELTHDGVRELELLQLAKVHYPKVYGAYLNQRTEQNELITRAQYIQASIVEQRASIGTLSADGYLVAQKFTPLPTIEQIVNELSGPDFDTNQFAAVHSVPTQLVIQNPYAVAKTLEELLVKVKSIIREREEKTVVVLDNAKLLPSLSGTEAQVEFALTIRNELYLRRPHDKRLTQATRADYWINNRDKLFV